MDITTKGEDGEASQADEIFVFENESLGECVETKFNLMNDKIAIKTTGEGEWVRIFFHNDKYVECNISNTQKSEEIPCSFPIPSWKGSILSRKSTCAVIIIFTLQHQ